MQMYVSSAFLKSYPMLTQEPAKVEFFLSYSVTQVRTVIEGMEKILGETLARPVGSRSMETSKSAFGETTRIMGLMASRRFRMMQKKEEMRKKREQRVKKEKKKHSRRTVKEA